MGHLLSGMLLLVQGVGHLMFIIPLPITMCSPPACADRDVIRVSRQPGDRSLYLSGILRVRDPVLYIIYCHFCTKYEPVCSGRWPPVVNPLRARDALRQPFRVILYTVTTVPLSVSYGGAKPLGPWLRTSNFVP